MSISAHRKSKSGPMALRLGSCVPKGLPRSRKFLVWPCDFSCACCGVQKPTLSRRSNFLLVRTAGSKARAHRPVSLGSCSAFCMIYLACM